MGSSSKDFILKLFTQVTHSQMLHAGYWSPDQPLSQEELHKAQAAYIDKVLEFIPDSAKSVLDVGCGTGETAARLCFALNKDVECVTPDLLQKEMFEKKYAGKIPLHSFRFEDLRLNRQFDCVLMMESCEYLDLDLALPNVREHLKGDGVYIVSDFFRTDEDRDYHSFHTLDHFHARLAKNGFEISRSLDITENTVPTLIYARKIYLDYISPIANTLLESALHSLSKKWINRALIGFVKMAFKQRLEKAENDVFHRVPRLLDPENYRSKVKYMIYEIKKANL